MASFSSEGLIPPRFHITHYQKISPRAQSLREEDEWNRTSIGSLIVSKQLQRGNTRDTNRERERDKRDYDRIHG